MLYVTTEMCTAYKEEWTWPILLIAFVAAALAALILIILIRLCCGGNKACAAFHSTEKHGQNSESHTYENSAFSAPPGNDSQTDQSITSGNQNPDYADIAPPGNNPQTVQGGTSGTAVYGNAAIPDNKMKQRQGVNETPQK